MVLARTVVERELSFGLMTGAVFIHAGRVRGKAE
jgi:hypothetical protein